MNKQDDLRYKIKILKAQGAISSYKEIAEEYLDTSYRGFINWLNGSYNYGYKKQQQLEQIISDLIMPI